MSDAVKAEKKGFGVREALLVAGLGLLAGGCWFVWPPLSAIAPGVVLTGVAVFGVRS